MIRRLRNAKAVTLLLILACTVVIPSPAAGRKYDVIIIQDEMPQMDVLASFLREAGAKSVLIADQQTVPREMSSFEAVIVFIHRDLSEETEKLIIDYTKKGGKLICLHHSISSKKAANEFYFDFLGMQLDSGTMEEGGYKWKASGWSLVNLNQQHYVTKFKVDWGDPIDYASSDQPSVTRSYPSIRLEDDSEVFINHKFTDGREKTVLCGIVYRDKESGRTYMQDRGLWLKRCGKGTIVYFMPGHAASDYENPNVSQIILNAINYTADVAEAQQ